MQHEAALGRWGQQPSLQLDPVPPRGQSLLFPLPNFPIPRASSRLALRYRGWVTGISAPNLPFYALPDLLVPAPGELWGFLLCSCFSSKSQAFVPSAISALKFSWHTLGILVQKLVFLCFSSTQGTDALPGAWQTLTLQRGGAVPVRSEPAAPGSVSTDRPCSVSRH